MTQSSIATDIRAFIVENFLFGDETQPLAETTSLIESDLIDSTGVLELVAFLEERYRLRINDNEIVPANLDSIARITSFVMSKTVPTAVAS